MPYTIEVRSKDSMIIAIMDKGFNPGQDLEGYVQELKTQLDQLSQPVVLITDVTDASAGFGDVVAGLGLLTQGKLAVLGHPNISHIIVVTTNNLYAMGAKALGQPQYGSLHVSVASTLEEAIEQVQQGHSAQS